MSDHGNLDQYREEAMDFLAQCYSQDLLTMDDYERRIQLVGNAEGPAQIRDVLFDLQPVVRSSGMDPAPGSPTNVPFSGQTEEDARVITILSSRTVSGNWLQKRYATAVSVLGETTIDMTDEDLPADVQIHVVALMGEVKIYVPLSASVQNSISPILGEVKEKTKRGFLPSSGYGVQRLRITGVAVMGEVKIIRK